MERKNSLRNVINQFYIYNLHFSLEIKETVEIIILDSGLTDQSLILPFLARELLDCDEFSYFQYQLQGDCR